MSNLNPSSSFVDATSAATEHCEAMGALHPDLAADYETIGSLVSSKLWHQLTLKLLALLETQQPRTTADGTNSFLALYHQVVLVVQSKLQPLSLARMASAVATTLLPTDATASKALFENLLADKEQLGVPATIYAQSKLGLLQLSLLERNVDTSVDLERLKTTLAANAALLQELTASQDADGIIHSAHYQCSMVYYKAVGPPESYYQQALSYLQYTSLEQMDNPLQLAVDLSLAALTGEGVFQLSQVVETPLLNLLQGTDKQWLLELLQAASHGDVDLFATLSTQHAAQIQQEPALTLRATAVQEKITLLALVHMVFERPPHERTLTFVEIAQRIRMPLEQVELVLMRALSLQLLEGTMDQVDGTISVTWVLPRVLTKSQMHSLSTRFGEWAVKVSKTQDVMNEQTSTLLA